MNKIKLSSIVATAQNNAIGKDDKLLWHLPEDFAHFKRTTMGKPMIMGRKTFDSLPGALKGRDHIIISRSTSQADVSQHIHYRKTIENAIALGKEIAAKDNVDEVFIIGGGEIYRQTMPLIDNLYLTQLHCDYEGDTYFPEIDWNEWDIKEKTKHPADPEKDRPAFTIYTLERKA